MRRILDGLFLVIVSFEDARLRLWKAMALLVIDSLLALEQQFVLEIPKASLLKAVGLGGSDHLQNIYRALSLRLRIGS
jgi:hypothetical protein